VVKLKNNSGSKRLTNKKTWKIEFKQVKAHVGIYGNKIEDRLGREATQNYHVIYSRIQKIAIKKGTP
jgi:hypothetical protein